MDDIITALTSFYLYKINAKKLKKNERTDFGLPDREAYPMPDKEHVRKAIQMFDYAKPSERDELAKNIMKYIKKYHMENMSISKDTNFGKIYYKSKS